MNPEQDVAKRKRGRPRLDAVPTVASEDKSLNGDSGTVGPESLVEMALALLSERPPSEITRASLARHANVHPSLIRYYFKNRDSLMRTVAQSLTKALQERATAASSGRDETAADQIRTRARALLAFKLDNPFYHRLMMEDMARSDSNESVGIFDQVAGSAIARYQSYIDDGVASGTLKRVNAAFLYMAIIGLCDFYVTASPSILKTLDDAQRTTADEEYADFICDLLINGLRAA